MTDRELLELAAKAAGITLEWLEEYCYIPDDDPEIDPLWRLINGWNPLEDDGDALRLAVYLSDRITIHKILSQNKIEVRLRNINWFSAYEFCNEYTDFYAATRRAIVRAAAEIGKAMP